MPNTYSEIWGFHSISLGFPTMCILMWINYEIPIIKLQFKESDISKKIALFMQNTYVIQVIMQVVSICFF